MSDFKFRLEKVLDLRKFQQEQAEIELGKAVAAENEIQTNIETLAMQHATVVRQLKHTKNLAAISSAQQYFAFLDGQKDQLLKDLAAAKLVTEEKRNIMQEAVQNYRALSKVKEKENDIYRLEELQKEENMSDDIVTSRFRSF